MIRNHTDKGIVKEMREEIRLLSKDFEFKSMTARMFKISA